MSDAFYLKLDFQKFISSFIAIRICFPLYADVKAARKQREQEIIESDNNQIFKISLLTRYFLSLILSQTYPTTCRSRCSSGSTRTMPTSTALTTASCSASCAPLGGSDSIPSRHGEILTRPYYFFRFRHVNRSDLARKKVNVKSVYDAM